MKREDRAMEILERSDQSLLEIVDHVLNKGVVIRLVDERNQRQVASDKLIPLPDPGYTFYFEGGLLAFVKHLNRGLGAACEDWQTGVSGKPDVGG